MVDGRRRRRRIIVCFYPYLEIRNKNILRRDNGQETMHPVLFQTTRWYHYYQSLLSHSPLFSKKLFAVVVVEDYSLYYLLCWGGDHSERSARTDACAAVRKNSIVVSDNILRILLFVLSSRPPYSFSLSSSRQSRGLVAAIFDDSSNLCERSIGSIVSLST